jgi:hypothetical protein
MNHKHIEHISKLRFIFVIQTGSIIRLLAFQAGITNPKQFYKWFSSVKKQYKCKSFDELAVMLTSN